MYSRKERRGKNHEPPSSSLLPIRIGRTHTISIVKMSELKFFFWKWKLHHPQSCRCRNLSFFLKKKTNYIYSTMRPELSDPFGGASPQTIICSSPPWPEKEPSPPLEESLLGREAQSCMYFGVVNGPEKPITYLSIYANSYKGRHCARRKTPSGT